jgi:poly(A) polymerase
MLGAAVRVPHNSPMTLESKSSAAARARAAEICRGLTERGFTAYFVGGCVRDLLLGREPADYDVATNATPIEVQEIFPGSLTVGAQFGVVIVPGEEAQIEVATFRSDIGYSDGRHPDNVVFTTTPEQDAARRDFTINGMFMDPANDRVLDFVGGQKDLEAGIIRAIGDAKQRFTEDKLRLARAVRFAARFGYEIEQETFKAIRTLAREIMQVSAERLRDELTKMLTEGEARRAFEYLDETWLLSVVLPEIARMHGVEQPPQYHPEGDVWIHTMLMIEQLPAGCAPTLAWGVLLHDVGKPATFRSAAETGDRIRFDNHVDVGVKMAEAICSRLRFSNEDTEQIAALVANHMKFKDVTQMRTSTLKRFVRLPHFDEHLELHRLDCLSSHRQLDNLELVEKFIADTPPEQVRPPRLITGDDLRELGFRPGPQYKTILEAVEEAQLEGKIGSREEALAYVASNYQASDASSS